MSLKTLSLQVSPTGVAYPNLVVANHTALPFKVDGQVVSNGIHLVATIDENFATRRQVTAKVRPATLDPKTGIYNKDKKSMVYVIPELIEGKMYFHTVRTEIEMHPMTAMPDLLQDLRGLGAQCLVDPDTDDYWKFGSSE